MRANVPINASVAITPRTRSLCTVSVIAAPDRFAHHRLPGRLGIRITAGQHVAVCIVAGAQWFGQRRPQPSSHDPAAPVELGERSLVAGGADRGEVTVRADQQPGPAGRRGVGCVGRVAAPGQPHPGTEVVDDASGQQADQIRVAGQPRIDAVERVRRDRRPTDVVQPLQHLHPSSGAGQVGGGDQAVVPAADDDDIGIGCHGVQLAEVALDLAGRARLGLPRIAAGSRATPGAAAAGPSIGRGPPRPHAVARVPRIRDVMMLQLGLAAPAPRRRAC